MSTIKFDLQLFGPGPVDTTGEGGSWTQGVTKSAVESTYDAFSNKIDNAIEAIRDYSGVTAALEAGWSGQDRLDFLEKYRIHTEHVIEQIEEYRTNVRTTVDSIISQWEEFQTNLVK